MDYEETRADNAEKLEFTPEKVDPNLSDDVDFGQPENDSRSYRAFLTLFAALAALLALFHLYTAQFGILTGVRQRAVHLTLVLVLTFMIKPANRKNSAPICRLFMTVCAYWVHWPPADICMLWMRSSPHAPVPYISLTW